MSSTAAESAPTWDLSHLIDLESAGVERPDGDGQPDGPAAVDALLTEAQRRADAFADAHEGKVAELDGPGLREAMTELAAISELAGRALNYTHLGFAGDTADPAIGALAAELLRARHHSSTRRCSSSSSSGSRSTTSGPRSCSPPTGSTSAATTCGSSAATGRTC